MKRQSLLFVIMAVVLLVACAPRPTPSPAPAAPPTEAPTEEPTPIIPLPEPDPLNSEGDELYSIYRKGLVTRHITTNGRLLEAIALESIDGFTPEDYDGSGYIYVDTSSGKKLRIQIDNVRYSYELIPGTNDSKAYLWVPVLGPLKDPGYGNDGYYVASGGGDNPGYYGGMALATFSLEHIYGVSDYSIHYARRIVQYFLNSEMSGRNGYIIRRANFYNSGENKNAAPILRGASSEELLGIMLGLMYYLRAEDPSYPLHSEALQLRDRILKRVSEGYIWENYEHPFMVSNNDESYYVKHFEFPMYASKGEPASGTMKTEYVNLLTQAAGTTRSIADVFGDTNFYDYPMFLTSMILILDGTIPDDEKEWFAEVFMRDFIKAAYTVGPDEEGLKGNAYMGLIAKLANKYLNGDRDSELEGGKLDSIWQGEPFGWGELMTAVDIKVANPQSLENDVMDFQDWGNRLHWQHNLPLMNKSSEKSDVSWKNHNPNNRIGAWFIWGYRWPYYWERGNWKWESFFPGMTKWGKEGELPWANNGTAMSESEYMQSEAHRFTPSGFVERELVQTRGHIDNQVEGAGLGLTFLRMLLTHINPETYPPPVLTEDKSFPVLRFEGVEPMSPQYLKQEIRYPSRQDGSETHKEIEGDTDESLRIINLSPRQSLIPGPNFVVAYATEDEKLMLVPGFVTDGVQIVGAEISEGIYLHPTGTVWKRFDKAILAATGAPNGDHILVVAERAEENQRDSYCRDHWLRLSIWKISAIGEGYTGYLTKLDKWASTDRYCKSVKEIDMTIVGDSHIAVIFKSRHDKNRIAMFNIDFSTMKLHDTGVRIFAGTNEKNEGDIAITSAFDNVVVSSSESNGRFRLHSRVWTGSGFGNSSISSLIQGRVLDLTTVKQLDFAQKDYASNYYIVAAVDKDGYLQVLSWEVQPDGTLVYIGDFKTEFGEQFLVGRESGYERASITPVYFENKPGFVIAGKGHGREVTKNDGSTERSEKGLKVVYGQILADGRPTVLSSNLLGSGDSSAMSMLDVTGNVRVGMGNRGVITAHKTKDNHLVLAYWKYDDQHENLRWSR